MAYQIIGWRIKLTQLATRRPCPRRPRTCWQKDPRYATSPAVLKLSCSCGTHGISWVFSAGASPTLSLDQRPSVAHDARKRLGNIPRVPLCSVLSRCITVQQHASHGVYHHTSNEGVGGGSPLAAQAGHHATPPREAGASATTVLAPVGCTFVLRMHGHHDSVSKRAPRACAKSVPRVCRECVPRACQECAESVPKVCRECVPRVCAASVPRVRAASVPRVCAESVPRVCAESVCRECVPSVCRECVPRVCAKSVPLQSMLQSCSTARLFRISPPLTETSSMTKGLAEA